MVFVAFYCVLVDFSEFKWYFIFNVLSYCISVPECLLTVVAWDRDSFQMVCFNVHLQVSTHIRFSTHFTLIQWIATNPFMCFLNDEMVVVGLAHTVGRRLSLTAQSYHGAVL